MYCNPIWGGTYDSHLHTLVILQKKCLRIIFGVGFLDHTLPLFIRGKILKIKDVHGYSMCCFIYKNSSILESLTRSHPYQTRNTSYIPKFQRLTICQRSVYFSGVKFWNMLSQNLTAIDQFPIFKKRLKFLILEGYT